MQTNQYSTEVKRGTGPEQFIAAVELLHRASQLAPMPLAEHIRCQNAAQQLLQRFTTTENSNQSKE